MAEIQKIKQITIPIDSELQEQNFDIATEQYNVIGNNTVNGINGYKVLSLSHLANYCEITVDDKNMLEQNQALVQYKDMLNKIIYFEGKYLNYNYLQITSLHKDNANNTVITVQHVNPQNLEDIVILDTTNDPTKNWVYVLDKPAAGILVTSSNLSFAIGKNSKAIGESSYASGEGAQALGRISHAEGRNTKATYAAHAEGDTTEANGHYSHAEGYKTRANAARSHTEGYSTYTNGVSAHAEGYNTQANGDYGSHAEGLNTIANGESAHVEGKLTKADGTSSHAEGTDTRAIGPSSHAEGESTIAEGYYSHAQGYHTHALGDAQSVFGRINKVDKNKAVIIGNGESKQKIIFSDDFETFPSNNWVSIVSGASPTKTYNDYYNKSYSLFIQSSGGEVCSKIIAVNPKHIYGLEVMTLNVHGVESAGIFNVYSADKKELIASYKIGIGDKYEAGQNQKNWNKEIFENLVIPENVFDIYLEFKYENGSIGLDNLKLYDLNDYELIPSNAMVVDWDGNAWYAGTVETTGVILKSPNGTSFLLTVDDTGNLNTQKIEG